MTAAPDHAAGTRTVVIGIGNVLQRDDGVGPRVVGALAAARAAGVLDLPPETSLVDGGTAGSGLVGVLQGADTVVLVDALAPRGTPGRITTLDVRDAAAWTTGPVGQLLASAALAGVLPRRACLVGIEAARTDTGTALSAEVGAAVGPAMAAVLLALGERGVAT